MHDRKNHKGPHSTTHTHEITDNAGDSVLIVVLKRMEEIENENKTLKEQMREQQERVEKIRGAPKLLPKRDVGRFVEQPYSEEAAPHAILKTFNMAPYLRSNDGTTDPKDHVTYYVTVVKGNDLTKEQVSSILMKIFGKTLTRGDDNNKVGNPN